MRSLGDPAVEVDLPRVGGHDRLTTPRSTQGERAGGVKKRSTPLLFGSLSFLSPFFPAFSMESLTRRAARLSYHVMVRPACVRLSSGIDAEGEDGANFGGDRGPSAGVRWVGERESWIYSIPALVQTRGGEKEGRNGICQANVGVFDLLCQPKRLRVGQE